MISSWEEGKLYAGSANHPAFPLSRCSKSEIGIMYNESNSGERIEPNNYAAAGPKRASSQRRFNIWLGVLTGLAVLSTALLVVLAVGLRRENARLTQQIEAIEATDAAMANRIGELESQTELQSQNLALLNQQVPKGLANQIKAISKKLSTLQAAEAKTVTRGQMEQAIQRVVKKQNQAAASNPAIFTGPGTVRVEHNQGAGLSIPSLPSFGNCPGTTSENCSLPSGNSQIPRP